MMHKDKRGIILDLIVGKGYALTLITFTPGAVRGNHLHKKTVQWDFILWGKLTGFFGKRKRGMGLFAFQKIGKNRPHAYKAIKKSVMFSFTKGVRVGEDYGKDMIKLETPLI